MGFVFEAEDTALQRQVAVKVMRPEVAAQPEAKGRFLREARAAAGLHDDHVVTIYHVGEERGVPFLVMPLMKGETLHDRMKVRRLTIAEIVRIGRGTAQGLAAAHAAGLVHRDIKPANLWLEAPTGRVRVLDFGLARPVLSDNPLTQTGEVLGTPAFMAPEQARGQTLDARADLFSLGCVLYLLTTDTKPFQGIEVMLHGVRPEKLAPPCQLNPTVPPALSDLIMRLMAPLPQDRPQTAAAVVAELISIGGSRAGRTPPIADKPRLNGKSSGDSRSEPPPLPAESRPVKPPSRSDLATPPVGATAGPSPRHDNRGWIAIGIGGITAVSLIFAAVAAHQRRPATAATSLTLDLGTGVTMETVHIPAGSFTMGSPKAEHDEYERCANRDGYRATIFDEEQHPTRISKGFFLGKYPVTQAQYRAITGENPSAFSATGSHKVDVQGLDTSSFPVERVSWEDATAFCEKLSRRSGMRVGLPTEAQWEYACRATSRTAYHFGDNLDGTQANCDGNYPFGADVKGPNLKRPSEVGTYASSAPHPWGLCDMHGNVWQWCQDSYDADFYNRSPRVDPLCSDGESEYRVLRGGSWSDVPRACRAARRLKGAPGNRSEQFGFRVMVRGD
jgi:formylglycine-generating enzyme required for sulfatase activity